MTVFARPLFVLTGVREHGGIQRFNQLLLKATMELGVEFDQVAMTDDAQGSRIRFVWLLAREILGRRRDLVVIGHVNYLVLTALLSMVRVVRQPRLVMIAHGLEVWYRLTPMQKWALRRVGRILSVSAYTRSRIAALAPGVPPDLMEIFPNAVSSDFSRKPASSATDRGTEKISPRFYLTVSRLDRRERAKGILTLLEAMSGLEDDRIRLVVAGDGNDRAFLMQVAERLGLANRVKWIGSVDDATLLDLYSRCTAFVLPSCQEGFGIVYLEAMRCGAPVIAAREKGVVDVVMHRETGLLVEFGDVVGLMAAMSEIDRDALLRVRVRKAALAQVTGRGRFTYAAFKERWSTTLFHGAGVTKLSYKSTSI